METLTDYDRLIQIQINMTILEFSETEDTTERLEKNSLTMFYFSFFLVSNKIHKEIKLKWIRLFGNLNRLRSETIWT